MRRHRTVSMVLGSWPAFVFLAGCGAAPPPPVRGAAPATPAAAVSIQDSGEDLLAAAAPSWIETRPAKSDPRLSCTLVASSITEWGRSPPISVRFVNRAEQEILLCRCLDGSTDEMRYPFCVFDVDGPPNRRVYGGGRCGNVNGLKADDFVPVQAGGRFTPFGDIARLHPWSHHLHPTRFREPGLYRIQLTYDASSTVLDRWNGGPAGLSVPSPECSVVWARAPKLAVASNVLKIVVLYPIVEWDPIPQHWWMEAPPCESDATWLLMQRGS